MPSPQAIENTERVIMYIYLSPKPYLLHVCTPNPNLLGGGGGPFQCQLMQVHEVPRLTRLGKLSQWLILDCYTYKLAERVSIAGNSIVTLILVLKQ